MCIKTIRKKRYKLSFNGKHIWEIDIFEEDNEGLITAEVELEELEDLDEKVELPDFITEEVTGDPRYLNSHLVKNPYKVWE